MARKSTFGDDARKWLTENLGNPVMGSQKQNEINKIDGITEEERRAKAWEYMPKDDPEYVKYNKET